MRYEVLLLRDKAVRYLKRHVRGWSDERYNELMNLAVKEFRFKREEISMCLDPRIFVLLDRARKARALKG
jgi:hypothetical protein